MICRCGAYTPCKVFSLKETCTPLAQAPTTLATEVEDKEKELWEFT